MHGKNGHVVLIIHYNPLLISLDRAAEAGDVVAGQDAFELEANSYRKAAGHLINKNNAFGL